MARIRFILVGAVCGLAWAASLRAFMMVLAGPDSTFTYSGTFGIIIPTGTLVGALLGWAEYQRRIGHQYAPLIAAPLLIGIIPNLVTAEVDLGPIDLAVIAMIGGYAISGRGPLWTRIVAGIINLSGVAVIFIASKPFPDLSYTTPHGAWFDTLAASLGMTLALACSIPMRRPETTSHPAGRTSTTDGSGSDHWSIPSAPAVARRTPTETTSPVPDNSGPADDK
jgi:hypothetical protein